mgnify:FL=1|jgi:hypothetical protein
MNQIKIDKDVPMPERASRHRYPFKLMGVGDSFLVDVKMETVRLAAASYSYRSGRKFSVRQTSAGTRVWRIA